MKLNPTNTAILKRLLVGRNSRPLRSILQRVEPADLAAFLTQLHNLEKIRLVDALISVQKASTVLAQLPESQLEAHLNILDDDQIARMLKHGSITDGSSILQQIDSSRHESLLVNLSLEKKQKLLQFLNYPEDSAGRVMNSHVFTVPASYTAQQGLERLREKAQEESIYYIYCVTEDNQLTGVVSLRDLATSDPKRPLSEIAKPEIVTVSPEASSEEVAQLVSHYDFIAIPVIDKSHRILGVITVDDVLDIIEEQATADIYATAGLQESDRVYSSVSEKIVNRTPWMMLNLLLAGTASSVLYQFEHTLDDLVILAVTKNIVTSTSGNAAIQSLTVMTRGIAVDDFQFITRYKALIRETSVGMFMGLLTGCIAGLALFFLKKDMNYSLMVSIVMFISMAVTSVVACIAGAGVPLLLKHLNRDPAVGSGVIVTVITDIFGFFSFLGLATLGIHYFQL